jgi:hypothetical protein
MAETVSGGQPVGNIPASMMQALVSGQIPKFYSNGLALAATGTDITIICLDGATPVVAVTIAYPTAKSLSMDLAEGVKNFENKTGEKVKDVKELMALLHEK